MAHFEIIEGSPGQGKSLYTAKTALWLLRRNKLWHELGNPIRKVFSNLKFADKIEKEFENYLFYWADPSELCKLRECDILWDEIATELDSRNFMNLSTELKRFLSQYRKRGIDIYANTQDFSMIDARARIMITNVKSLSKIVGSRDPSTTKPKIRNIWGLIMVKEVTNFRETAPDKKKYGFPPSFFTIKRELVEIYDTKQDIKMGEPPPLKHEVRTCEDPRCNHIKISHS